MLEILQKQLKDRRVLSSAKHYHLIQKDLFPPFYWEMYPLVEEYYHELNPFFLFNVHDFDLLQSFSNVYTVRDGRLTFTHFLLKNFNVLRKDPEKLFLIHRDLVPIVPDILREKFAVWSIVRNREKHETVTRKVLVFAFVSEEYLGDLKKNERLNRLAEIPTDVLVELLLLNRRDLFAKNNSENDLGFELMDNIKDLLPQHRISLIKKEEFLHRDDLRGTHLIDLAGGNFLVSDNYIHHFALSLGATVEGVSEIPPEDSFLSIDLSFRHRLHISPLPSLGKDQRFFSDLLFEFKMNPNFLRSKIVHENLRTMP